jgi:hypothetical protein
MSDDAETAALLGRILKMLGEMSLRLTEIEVEQEMADDASRRQRIFSNQLLSLAQRHGQRIDTLDRERFDGDTDNADEIAMLRADLGYGPPPPAPPQRPRPRLVIDNNTSPENGGPYAAS